MNLIFFETQIIFIWINMEFFILVSAFYGFKIKKWLKKHREKK